MVNKSRKSKRSVRSSRRNSRRTCVRSFSPILSAKNASLFCQEAWMRNQSKVIGGAAPNTVQLFLTSGNISMEDRNMVRFLWNKYEQFRDQQMVGEKRWIADALWTLIQNVLSSYKNQNFVSMVNSPKLLAAMTYLFDEIVADFEERVENPVKSCKLLPGKFGRPAACPEKNSSKLHICISEFTPILKEAKRLRRTAEQNPTEFIQKVLQFFSTVQASPTCLSFTRIENFAKNKGKYTAGNMELFRVLADHYQGNVYEPTKIVNSNNRVSTISRASSVSYEQNYAPNY